MEHLEFSSITDMARYLESTERLPGAGEFSIRSQSERGPAGIGPMVPRKLCRV